jgi:hypothetical protein
MGLGDVMGTMGLQWFAQIGLAVSVAGFAGVLLALVLRRNRAAFERARFMPLEDDGVAGDRREARHE